MTTNDNIKLHRRYNSDGFLFEFCDNITLQHAYTLMKKYPGYTTRMNEGLFEIYLDNYQFLIEVTSPHAQDFLYES